METTDDVLPEASTVRLRPVEDGDLATLRRWDADPVISDLMGRRFVTQSPEEWLRQLRRGRSCRVWIIEWTGQSVGEVELAQLNHRSRSAELRICVGERAHWGKGIGTAAMAHLLDHAFGPMRLESVYLRVFANNRRAVALYRRFGFRTEAVLRPSQRRNDPAPVMLMNLSRGCWLDGRAG